MPPLEKNNIENAPIAPPVQKRSHLTLIVLIIVCLLAAAGAGYYFYIQSPQSVNENVVTEQPVIKESAVDKTLLIEYVPIPTDENSAFLFNKLATTTIAKEDQDFLNSTSTFQLTKAKQVLARNKKYLDVFDQSSRIARFQCMQANFMLCYLNSVRNASKLGALKAKVLLKEGKIEEAQKYALSVIALGKKVTAGSYEVIELLNGWGIQKLGYNTLIEVNKKSKAPTTFSSSTAQDLIQILRSEHKNTQKYHYTRGIELIDYITSIENKPKHFYFDELESEIIVEYRQKINSVTWDPEETKGYLTTSHRISIENIDLPCDATLKEPYTLLEVSETESPDTQKNYVGKTFYNNASGSVETLNKKRCEVEKEILKLVKE